MHKGWLLAFIWFGCAWSDAQTLIEARPLLSDEAIAYRATFIVEIQRRGGDTSGELVVQSQSGDLEYIFPLDLAVGARKQIPISVPLRANRWFEAQWVEWRGEDGERVSVELLLPVQAHLPVVVVGDLVGGLQQLDGAEVEFISQLLRERESRTLPLKVYYRRPTDLPDDWQLLWEVPVIVLVEGAETLHTSQWQALQHWLSAGGTLVVAEGMFPKPLLAQMPIAQLLSDASSALPKHRRVGLGNLYLLEYDPSLPESSNRLKESFTIYAEASRLPSELLQEQLRRQQSGSLMVAYARLGAGMAALSMYLILVWVLTVYWRRRRMLDMVFAPLVGASVAASGLVWWFSPRFHSPQPTVVSMHYQSHARHTFEVSFVNTVLEGGAHTLQLPEDAALIHFESKPSSSARLRYASASPTLEIRCRARTWVSIQWVRPVQSQPPLLAVERQGQSLIMSNISGKMVQNLQVRILQTYPPQTLWSAARVAPGETVHAPLGIWRRSDVWVWWDNPVPIPQVRLNGSPVREVRCVCFWVP